MKFHDFLFHSHSHSHSHHAHDHDNGVDAELRLSHQQDPSPERFAAARKTSWVSAGVNFVLATAQVVIGVFSHSQSLVSDGIHSLTDLISDFVVLAANRLSHTGVDQSHPYGHGRFENLASMILGLLLVLAGGAMLFAAGHKFIDPADIPQVHVIAFYTAAMTIVAKEILFRWMAAVGRRVNSTMLVANAYHARADAISSIVVALGIAGNLMGYKFLDPLAAAIVGLMICRTGFSFAFRALSQLMDSGLSPEETLEIRNTFLETAGVLDAHDLRTRYMGDDVLIDVHLQVGKYLSASEAHQIGNEARFHVRRVHHVLDVLVHIDTEDDCDIEDKALPLPSRETILEVIPDAVKELDPKFTIYYHLADIEMEWHFMRALTEEEMTLAREAEAKVLEAFPVVTEIRIFIRQE
jgi:cation diffusion facilitator family transporter